MLMHDYATASELFEAARDAAQQNESMRRRIERMELAEMGTGQGEPIAKGFIADKMARVDSRLDLEEEFARAIEENWALIDEATNVLYGEDGRTGLALALGIAYADAIWWRYLAAAKWSDVAQACGATDRTCQTRVQVGLDFIDANGIEATRAGENLIN